MSTTAPKKQRLDVRLAADLKAILEEAAARTRQTLSDFVVSTLAEKGSGGLFPIELFGFPR